MSQRIYFLVTSLLCCCCLSCAPQDESANFLDSQTQLAPIDLQTESSIPQFRARTHKVNEQHGVMLQAFHWYEPADGKFWDRLGRSTSDLADKGFTSLWLPPAYKGFGGSEDNGYGVYDLYDLGEFQQKGTIATKYGTKDQYLKTIQAAHKVGLEVIADIVMNHRIGADQYEIAPAVEVDPQDRNRSISAPFNIKSWTKFDFKGRQGRYSDFQWNWTHFTGVDWDHNNPKNGKIYRFDSTGKYWSQEVSKERGNYDFLMGADIDYNNPEVVSEMKRWGTWYTDFTQIDGYRLDAVKHIKSGFVKDWLDQMRAHKKAPLFAVAEYWDSDVNRLLDYLRAVNAGENRLALFDVSLHFNFHNAGRAQGNYDLAGIFRNTLTDLDPQHAVSFVDNHDTQPLQSLESPVADWFKPIAYALILLRTEAYPSVFAADYYGAEYGNKLLSPNLQAVRIPSIKNTIDQLLFARKNYAYGSKRDYFDNQDIIGWTRSGDSNHPNGMAVLLSDRNAGVKNMLVGPEHAGSCFRNLIRSSDPCVTIDTQGRGEFRVDARSFAVWVSEREKPVLPEGF